MCCNIHSNCSGLYRNYWGREGVGILDDVPQFKYLMSSTITQIRSVEVAITKCTANDVYLFYILAIFVLEPRITKRIAPVLCTRKCIFPMQSDVCKDN